MYTKSHFGKELEQEIAKNFDIVRLSRWAYSKYLDKASELNDGVNSVIMNIVAMEEGPEFEYTKEGLIQLAKDMQK